MMILQELSILALTFLTTALAVVAGEEELGQQIVVEQTFDEFPVSIIHINDFHARFDETNTHSSFCKPGETCIGGYARVVSAVKQLKSKRTATNPIYLNAGDNFQGTLWYEIGRWNVTSTFLNMLPADAMTIGNHEFDHSVEGLVPFLETINSSMVVCNIDVSEEPTMWGKFQKSMIIDKYDRKIGIIGVTSATTKNLAPTGNVRFHDECESVRAEAAALKAQGVDIIIVLSHSGVAMDKKIARNGGPDIDVIVGGHSHTFMFTGRNPPGGMIPEDEYPAIVNSVDDAHKVLVVQAAAFAKLVGDLTVFFDNRGKIVRWEGLPLYLDQSIIPDPAIVAELQPWKQIIDREGLRVIGTTKVDLSIDNCTVGECNIGSFFADAFALAMIDDGNKEEEDWTHASIVFIAVDGIRTSLSKGNITYGDLVGCYPFGDTLDTVDMLGKDLIMALEYSTTKTLGEYRYNFLQSSGIKVVLNLTRPIGDRVVSVDILCGKCAKPEYQPLDPMQTYRVVTGAYLAAGGDGFEVFPDYGFNHRSGPSGIDVLLKYVERMSPIMSVTDGRLTIIT